MPQQRRMIRNWGRNKNKHNEVGRGDDNQGSGTGVIITRTGA